MIHRVAPCSLSIRHGSRCAVGAVEMASPRFVARNMCRPVDLPEVMEAMAGPSEAALAAVQARRTQDLRWLDLPHQQGVQRDVLDYAASMQDAFRSGDLENVVVLGIGGSALGNRALHAALSSPFHDIARPEGMPRLFVLDLSLIHI